LLLTWTPTQALVVRRLDRSAIPVVARARPTLQISIVTPVRRHSLTAPAANAFFNCCACCVQSVIYPVFLFLHFHLGCCAHVKHGNTT